MKLIYIFLFSLVVSCASKVDKTFERVSVEQYYRQSGTVKYFLSDIPEWANTSYEGNCFREETVKFLDLANVMKSFDFSYQEALQLQYIYNIMYNDLVKTKKEVLTLKEEEKLFFKSLDQVKAGFKEFKAPTFARVNVVLVDSYLETKSKSVKLKELMDSQDMMNGRPLLISLCYKSETLKSKLKVSGINSSGSRFLTYEMLSMFDKDGLITARNHIDLGAFFKRKQEIYLYYINNRPRNILGKFKYKRTK